MRGNSDEMNRRTRKRKGIVIPLSTSRRMIIEAPNAFHWVIFLAVLVGLIVLHQAREQLGLSTQVVGIIRFLISILVVSGAIMLKVFVLRGWG